MIRSGQVLEKHVRNQKIKMLPIAYEDGCRIAVLIDPFVVRFLEVRPARARLRIPGVYCSPGFSRLYQH